jgi:hypothetical protein
MLGNLMHKDLQTLIFKGKNWKECFEVHKLHGTQIGLSSRSDKLSIIQENIEFLMQEKGCLMLVCAGNMNMKGLREMLNVWEAAGWELKIIRKMPEFCNRIHREMHPLLNHKAAIRLLEEIRLSLPPEN